MPALKKQGTTFDIDDWLAHTPKDVLAKTFGVLESTFDDIPNPHPNILEGTATKSKVTPSGAGPATGDGSYIYRTLEHELEVVPGGGGVFYKIDSSNLPVSTTLAATLVTLKPSGLRELHWHPDAEEWLYFHQGESRATIFAGSDNTRTISFRAGETAAVSDNSGKVHMPYQHALAIRVI